MSLQNLNDRVVDLRQRKQAIRDEVAGVIYILSRSQITKDDLKDAKERLEAVMADLSGMDDTYIGIQHDFRNHIIAYGGAIDTLRRITAGNIAQELLGNYSEPLFPNEVKNESSEVKETPAKVNGKAAAS